MHLTLRLCHAIWCFVLLLPLTLAQETIQQILWNIPDGKSGDFTQTFSNGNTLPLSWNALLTTSYVDTTQNLVDLWITAYDNSNVNTFNQSLLQHVNLTFSGQLSWTITIPEATLSVEAKYVLRFKASSPTYDPSSGELSSPGILILQAGATTTSLSSLSTTISATSVISNTSTGVAITSSISSSQSSQTDQASSSGNLNSGAKAGIGVGSVAAVSGIVGIVFFILRRRRSERATTTQASVKYQHEPQMSNMYKAELPAATAHPPDHAAELPAQ